MSTTPTSTTSPALSLPPIAKPRAGSPRTPAVPDLASLRLRKGISLEDIAGRTKIALRYLEAIERLDFATLPGGVYNTSYIRQYAACIDIDDWDLMAAHGAWERAQEAKIKAPSQPAGWSRLPAALRVLVRFKRDERA